MREAWLVMLAMAPVALGAMVFESNPKTDLPSVNRPCSESGGEGSETDAGGSETERATSNGGCPTK